MCNNLKLSSIAHLSNILESIQRINEKKITARKKKKGSRIWPPRCSVAYIFCRKNETVFLWHVKKCQLTRWWKMWNIFKFYVKNDMDSEGWIHYFFRSREIFFSHFELFLFMKRNVFDMKLTLKYCKNNALWINLAWKVFISKELEGFKSLN